MGHNLLHFGRHGGRALAATDPETAAARSQSTTQVLCTQVAEGSGPTCREKLETTSVVWRYKEAEAGRASSVGRPASPCLPPAPNKSCSPSVVLGGGGFWVLENTCGCVGLCMHEQVATARSLLPPTAAPGFYVGGLTTIVRAHEGGSVVIKEVPVIKVRARPSAVSCRLVAVSRTSLHAARAYRRLSRKCV